jgi:hypothetical protein
MTTYRRYPATNMNPSFDCDGNGADGFLAVMGMIRRGLRNLAVLPTLEQVDLVLDLLEKQTRKFTRIKAQLVRQTNS